MYECENSYFGIHMILKKYLFQGVACEKGRKGEEQRLYRQRISKASAYWRALRSVQIAKIWNSAAEQMNDNAWFMKLNMPALEMEGTLIDPKLLKVSADKLTLPQQFTAERKPDDAATIVVSWQNDPHIKGERLLDELMVVSYANDQFSPVTATSLVRGVKNGLFSLPPHPTVATHVYLFMASRDCEAYSESVCFEI